MPNLKARLLGSWIGDRLLRDALVESVDELGPRFRRVVLRAPWVSELRVAAGEKVQVFLPDVGSRTYTPFDVDPGRQRFSLLVYIHGERPGPIWGRGLEVATEVRLIGPQPSTPLDGLEGSVALFGDETSLAVARTLQAIPGVRDRATVRLEVASLADTYRAADALEIPRDALIEKEPADAHLAPIARTLAPAASIVLTGRASSIQKVRETLRAQGRKKHLVRAYWADGKSGLD